MNIGESKVDARTEARSARGVLREKSEPKARNARELRAKPKSRATPEMEQREGSEGLGEPPGKC